MIHLVYSEQAKARYQKEKVSGDTVFLMYTNDDRQKIAGVQECITLADAKRAGELLHLALVTGTGTVRSWY
ncbi:MAG: hypothetical protein ACI4UM_03405 [Succinivibrio sp.]